jgi:hypothetical protein
MKLEDLVKFLEKTGSCVVKQPKDIQGEQVLAVVEEGLDAGVLEKYELTKDQKGLFGVRLTTK